MHPGAKTQESCPIIGNWVAHIIQILSIHTNWQPERLCKCIAIYKVVKSLVFLTTKQFPLVCRVFTAKRLDVWQHFCSDSSQRRKWTSETQQMLYTVKCAHSPAARLNENGNRATVGQPYETMAYISVFLKLLTGCLQGNLFNPICKNCFC